VLNYVDLGFDIMNKNINDLQAICTVIF